MAALAAAHSGSLREPSERCDDDQHVDQRADGGIGKPSRAGTRARSPDDQRCWRICTTGKALMFGNSSKAEMCFLGLFRYPDGQKNYSCAR